VGTPNSIFVIATDINNETLFWARVARVLESIGFLIRRNRVENTACRSLLCRRFVNDLVVISVKNGSIFSKTKRMVAFYILAVTLHSPFIFLLRLCA
jgi:hypothetical protein